MNIIPNWKRAKRSNFSLSLSSKTIYSYINIWIRTTKINGKMNWRKHVTTWYFVRNSLKTVSGDHGWQIWKLLRVNPLLSVEKLSNEIMVVIPALKNNGVENKPDKNTIVEQISSASVVVNGDLKEKLMVKYWLVFNKFFS